MRIVLDTNVLVSGVLSPKGPCAEMLYRTLSGELQLLYDLRILYEYEAVLRRPRFRQDLKKTVRLLDAIRRGGIPILAAPVLGTLPDRDDEPFIGVALSGYADCVVTGNQKHFPPSLLGSTKVMSPADFLTELNKKT